MYRYLGITLEKLLMSDTLRGAKILAGDGGLNNRITKVNVMEVPDIIEWVSEGEFLLTTAYSIKDNINILLELIPKLNKKGVSGLGIKVGRYVNELPQNIIELANELSFPIIEVPFCVSHTDVISGILSEVMNDQMNMLLAIEAFNNEVMNIMIKGGNLKEIAQKLFDNIGNSLAIYENIYDSYEIISDSQDQEKIEKIVHEHIFKKYMHETKNTSTGNKVTIDDFDGAEVERITIPIVIENIEYGSVFIWTDKKTLTPLDNMLIESYVHVIALDFVKKLSLYNMESNYKQEFFDDLLSDNEARQEKAIERAKTFNYHKNYKHSVIIILLKDLNINNKNKTNFAQEAISSLLFIIGRAAKFSRVKILYVDKSDRVIILFASEPTNRNAIVKTEVIDFCEKLSVEISKKFEMDKFTIGIGRSYEGHADLWKSLEQAKLIVESLNKKSIGDIMHYDDLGLYKILSFDGLQGELAEFCKDTIKPLIEYDKVNNSELIKTLKVYFECDGNMKKISEKMYMHYNTIIYRLQKIKDITGMNLENGDSRLNLQIALKAMDLLHM